MSGVVRKTILSIFSQKTFQHKQISTVFLFYICLMKSVFVVGPLYPISGNTTQRALDGSSPLIVLQRPFVYFGQPYNQIYVNHNGHITFNNPWGIHVPQSFPMYGTMDIIAPFWTKFDNRQTGLVYYKQYTTGNILNQATEDINNYFPQFNFTASWVFVATWHEMPYWLHNNSRTTVQAVLISGGQYSFVLMNYGNISPNRWNVQVGYDTINSTHHLTVPGSFSSNASGNYSVFRHNSNVNVPG
uniref:Sushi, nidogen and EGF-like domain-containing protein 1 n=1 Tax=Poecilia reticulata TaxID=8081 RepID=A0A3P9NNN2_POERE